MPNTPIANQPPNQTDPALPPPSWLLSWASRHADITRAKPQARHVYLVRTLWVAGMRCVEDAAFATATAATYEAEIGRLGADVDNVAKTVRQFLLAAALTQRERRRDDAEFDAVVDIAADEAALPFN